MRAMKYTRNMSVNSVSSAKMPTQMALLPGILAEVAVSVAVAVAVAVIGRDTVTITTLLTGIDAHMFAVYT